MVSKPFYNARVLMGWNEEQIWELPNTDIDVEFDDGVFATRGRHTIISWYMWNIHRAYPRTPLLIEHHIGNGHMGSNTHLKVLSKVMFCCFDTHDHQNPIADIEILCKMVFENVNQMYNAFNRRLGAYVSTINAFDIVEILRHDLVAEANRRVKPNTETTEDTIDNTYRIIEKVLKDPTQLPNNRVARVARFGLVKMNQVLQCVGPIGYRTDIDSKIFPRPILTSFSQGMLTVEDVAKESRSAAKSLVFQKDPMKNAEYLNREIQLLAATVKNLHYVDCGSVETIPFLVKPGDIDDLLGIYYKVENGFERITDSHHHLVNRVIHIRSVFTCLHPDRYGVCAYCMGDISLSIPAYTNIGHFSGVQVQSKLSQAVLSVKHLDSSSDTEDIYLDALAAKYLRVGTDDKNALFLQPSATTNFSLIINADKVKGVHDLTYIEDTTNVPLTRISEFDLVDLLIPSNDGTDVVVTLNVSAGTRFASFSKDMLDHIKRKGWTISSDGNIVIDMSGWNIHNALFVLPFKHYNMVDYMGCVKACYKGTTKKNEPGLHRSLIHYDTISEALMAFHTLISSKIRVNLSHLQVLILATMANNPEEKDYYPPLAGNMGKICTYRKIMTNRSMAAAMAHQGQLDVMLDPDSYLISNRPSHPLDDILLP